jgi:hypothetical protein
MKITKATVTTAVRKAGCSCDIEVTRDSWNVYLDAPKGKGFATSGCGVDASVWGYGKPDWALALEQIKAIFAEGFIDYEVDEDEYDVLHGQ